MNKIKTMIGLCSVILCMGLMSNSGGRASVAGQGATGAPGEQTCGVPGCHASGNFDPVVEISVTDMDGIVVEEFFPGVNYNVAVTIAAGSGTPGAYGFQILALDNTDTDVSSWSNPSGNAQTVSLGARNYVEHNSPSASNIFEMQWTTDQEVADITFYAVGNAVNLNGSPGQDGIATTSVTIPRAVLSTNNLADDINLTISPNPVIDFLRIAADVDYESIEIIDLMGKRHLESTSGDVSIGHIPAGTYIVKLDMADGQIATRKIVKL